MSAGRRVPVILAVLTLACCAAQPALLSAGGMPLWSRAALDHGFPMLPLTAGAGAVVGALILGRHPRHPIGWLFCLGQLGTAGGQVAEAYGWAVLDGQLRGSAERAHVAAWLGHTSTTLLVTSLALLALLAPDGRLPGRRWRLVVCLVVLSMLLVLVGLALVPPAAMEPGGAPTASQLATVLVGSGQIGLTLCLLLGGSALVIRLRRASGEERQQLRWIAVAALVAASALVAMVAHNLARGGNVAADWRLALALSVGVLGVPVATGFAVLRYRLYDIDVVIGAAVKAGILTAFVTLGYVTVVTTTAELLGRAGPGSFAASLLALVVVAVVFQPLRRRMSMLADRVVYGQRADPYEALARFSRALADRVSDATVLQRFAEAFATATGALRVQARLVLPDGVQTVNWPDAPPPPATTDLPLALRDGTRELGEVRISLPPGRGLGRSQRRLAAELTAQAGLAFRNLQLDASLRARAAALARDSEELAASRRRLLAAEDDEREHLVRAIHRDVGRYLAPMAAEIDSLPALATEDPGAAARLLDTLEADANRALDALRHLAHGIFPDLLALRGLPVALQAHAQRGEQHITLEITDDVRSLRLQPSAEAAGYFCVVEVAEVLTPCHVLVDTIGDHVRIVCRGGWTAGLTETFVQRLADRVEAVDGSVRVEHGGTGQGEVEVRLPVNAATASPSERPRDTERSLASLS